VKNKHAFDMVHGTQHVFRILLEALANPGRVVSLLPYAAQFAGQGRRLALAATMLDQGTGFYWEGDRETGDEIRFLTGAPRVTLEEADFVFVSPGEGGAPPCAPAASGLRYPPNGGSTPVTPPPDNPAGALSFLSRVKQGTHLDPHQSALLFIDAEAGENGNPGETLSLRGPGIPPEGRTIRLSPGEAAWCRARDERGFEYPCGVELVFLREDDTLLALPRKTAFLWGPV
jgi:alpha-D-ribose 1-methylphosphonate 5-triphosphate synthase subunit PhnH